MDDDPQVQAKPELAFNDACYEERRYIKTCAERTKELLKHPRLKAEQEFVDQHSEMKANIMLAYRHLEDAAMRLGKAVVYQK